MRTNTSLPRGVGQSTIVSHSGCPIGDERLAAHFGHKDPPAASGAGIMPETAMCGESPRQRRQILQSGYLRRAPSGLSRGREQRRDVDIKRAQALTQHLAALAERGLRLRLRAACGRRQRLRPRHQADQRRGYLGRRHERRRIDVEKNVAPRSAIAPARTAGRSFSSRARPRCARRPRAGTSARQHRTRAATARARPRRPAAPWRCCRAGWRRCAPGRVRDASADRT